MFYGDESGITIEDLPDDFQRWGPDDSPFLLRGGEKIRETARDLHNARPSGDRESDEASNEPISRDMDEWHANFDDLDFPFVDTIPKMELDKRADTAGITGMSLGFIRDVDLDANLERQGLFGLFSPGNKTIKVSPVDTGFLRTTQPVILAHETGHAYHYGIAHLGRRAGYDDDIEEFFETASQRADAIEISERMRGPMPDAPPGTAHYRMNETELVADVFASLILEPEAARRTGPEAVDRMEDFLESITPVTD